MLLKLALSTFCFNNIRKAVLVRKMMAHVSNVAATSNLVEKLESGVYSINHSPRVFQADYSGVHLHRDGPYQDELKSLEDMDWPEAKRLTQKIEVDSYGDYVLMISMISAKHFDSREKLDELFKEDCGIDDDDHSGESVTAECITFEQALRHLNVFISCNMNYYLANLEEMERDLNHKVVNLDNNDNKAKKALKNELWYNLGVKMFGKEGESDDMMITSEGDSGQLIAQKILAFKDYRLLHNGGNDKLATARRGTHYILFNYMTS